MAKKKTPSGLVDQLRDYLQELPIARALGPRQTVSLKRTKRLERKLSREARPKQIAEELGISTQKWVSLRRQIRKGKVASPVLGDLLERTQAETVGVPDLKKVEFTADVPHKGRRKRGGRVWEIESKTWIQNNAPWMRDLKPGGFSDRRQALNWWGNAGAGAQYFAIVRQKLGKGRYRWHIYDMRTAAELSRKGNVKGQLRAQKILKQYG